MSLEKQGQTKKTVAEPQWTLKGKSSEEQTKSILKYKYLVALGLEWSKDKLENFGFIPRSVTELMW